MLFSVIIPVYNVEKFLRQSIDSVLQQEENDIEIILVDDGSKDSSGDICDEYEKRLPGVIRVIHKENEGLLLTRRRGIREAKGRWLIHLDSDDYMMPGVLCTIRETIERYDPDLIIGKIAYGAQDGKNIDYYSHISFYDGQVFENENKNALYKHFFLNGSLNAVCQKIMRRDIVDVDTDYSQWSRVSMAEDVLQSLPIINNSQKCVYRDKAFIYYRYNTESITKKRNVTSYIKSVFSLLDVIEEERKYYILLDISGEMIPDIATKHCKQLCEQIKQICTFNKEEKQVRMFLNDLRNNDTWQWLFSNANGKTLGKFSKLCFFLVSKGLTGSLCMLSRAF